MNAKTVVYVRPASYYGSLFDTLVKHHVVNEMDAFMFVDMEHNYEDLDLKTILYEHSLVEIYYLTHVNGTLPNNVHEVVSLVDEALINHVKVKEINWASLFRHKEIKINENADWRTRHTLDEDETFEQCTADFIEVTERM